MSSVPSWKVAIVEPGIIDTDMARALTNETGGSVYPHERRFVGMFTAALQNPIGPDLVGDKIRDIIEDDSAGLRHPVGPDAIPFLEWRAAMTDEEWIDWAAVDDDTWYSAIESDFGLDARI